MKLRAFSALLVFFLAFTAAGFSEGQGIKTIVMPEESDANSIIVDINPYTYDSLFILNWGGELFRWQQGQEGFELYAQGIPVVPPDFPRPIDVDRMNREEKERFSRMILKMFSDGDRLYGLNQRCGTFALMNEKGEMEWQPQTLDTSLLAEEGGWIQTLFAHDEVLYALMRREDAEVFADSLYTLVMIDLATGESSALDDLPIICATPRAEDEVLLLLRESGGAEPSLAVWNAKTKTMDPLPARFPKAAFYNGLAWDARKDAVYVAAPGALMRSEGGKDFEVIGSLPLDMLSPGTPGHILPDYYALSVGDYTLFPLDGAADASAGTLMIRGDVWLGDRLNAYRKASPNTVVQRNEEPITPAEAGNAIQSGEEETDIYLMRMSPALYAMLQKGYAADLSQNSALQAEFDSLYPAIRSALSDEAGTPLAYPLAMSAYHPSVSLRLWRQYMGDEALPRTFGEFFSAMERFIRQDDDARPDAYFVADMDAQGLLRWVLESYINIYENEEEPLRFDREPLRQVLKQLEDIRAMQNASGFMPQIILATQIADDEIKPEMFFLHNGSLNLGFELSGDRGGNLLPFTFEADETPSFAGQMDVLIISPQTDNMPQALELAKALAEKESDPLLYALLHPEANEPVPNPRAEEWIAADQTEWLLYDQAIKKAQNSGADESEIEQLRLEQSRIEKNLADHEERKWLLSERQVQSYRLIADMIHFQEGSRLLTEGAAEQMDRVCERYLDGQMKLDIFINELNNLSMLVYGEGK